MNSVSSIIRFLEKLNKDIYDDCAIDICKERMSGTDVSGNKAKKEFNSLMSKRLWVREEYKNYRIKMEGMITAGFTNKQMDFLIDTFNINKN